LATSLQHGGSCERAQGLGKDPGAKIDGMIVILVKMKLSFFKNDQKLITDTLDQLTDGVHALLDMTWFAKGAVKAKAPTGDVSFKNAFIRFSPRYSSKTSRVTSRSRTT
jgi:hypothetical protein